MSSSSDGDDDPPTPRALDSNDSKFKKAVPKLTFTMKDHDIESLVEEEEQQQQQQSVNLTINIRALKSSVLHSASSSTLDEVAGAVPQGESSISSVPGGNAEAAAPEESGEAAGEEVVCAEEHAVIQEEGGGRAVCDADHSAMEMSGESVPSVDDSGDAVNTADASPVRDGMEVAGSGGRVKEEGGEAQEQAMEAGEAKEQDLQAPLLAGAQGNGEPSDEMEIVVEEKPPARPPKDSRIMEAEGKLMWAAIIMRETTVNKLLRKFLAVLLTRIVAAKTEVPFENKQFRYGYQLYQLSLPLGLEMDVEEVRAMDLPAEDDVMLRRVLPAVVLKYLTEIAPSISTAEPPKRSYFEKIFTCYVREAAAACDYRTEEGQHMSASCIKGVLNEKLLVNLLITWASFSVPK